MTRNRNLTKEHLSNEIIDRYRRRQLAPDELISASDHLQACTGCVQRLAGPARVASVYGFTHEAFRGDSNDHLLYEQLAAYSNGTLSSHEAEVVERHLSTCDDCEADLQSFFDLSALIERTDQKPSIPTEKSATSLPAFRDRLRGLWQVPALQSLLPAFNFRTLVQAASVVLAAGLLIWGITRSTQRQIDRLTLENKQLQAENDSMRQAASSADTQLAQLRKENEDIRQSGGQIPTSLRLTDGLGQVTLNESGTIQGLEVLPSELRTDVENALTGARLEVASGPVVKIGQVGTLLGDGATAETFKLITPVSSIVLSNTPPFKWEPLAGATQYTVLVRDVKTGQEIESEPLSDTQWTPKQPLARGRTYAWMVEAVKDGNRLRAPALNQPYAGFKVLDKSAFDNIQRAQASWGNSHLVMGILYAKAGLKDAARKELKELQTANPDVPAINKLIKSLDSKR
jgi:anti-sigma factor RsiW